MEEGEEVKVEEEQSNPPDDNPIKSRSSNVSQTHNDKGSLSEEEKISSF